LEPISPHTVIDPVILLDLLLQRFSGRDLEEFAFRLGIKDYADLPGDTRPAKARALIRYFSDRGELEKVVVVAQELRPTFDWTAETRQSATTQPPATPLTAPAITPVPRPQADTADAEALNVLWVFKTYFDAAWDVINNVRRPETPVSAGVPAAPAAQPVPWPQPEPESRKALSALRVFKGYLDEAWGVFINQNNYRNRLARMIRTELPHIAAEGQGYNQMFYNAYPELSPEGRELFAIVRGISQENAYQANTRIRKWIRDHPIDELLPERTPAAVELERQVRLLAMHLDSWFTIYKDTFLPDARRALVYAGDEQRLGQPWPRGVEPAVDAMIAELSKGDLRVVYDRRTDTLTLVFSDTPAAESAEGKPGILLDYDGEGKLVSLMIQQASARANVPGQIQYEISPA
jgi:uncharacterized protein YuzE